jgi:protein-disulfide isomerase
MNDNEYEADLAVPVSEQDHAQGPADAAVTLVEYGDYQCPYCGAAYPVVKGVQRGMGDRLRFVFRNFPISTSHPHAQGAAEAAEAAGAQGKFWEMHDMLYEHQAMLDQGHLLRMAEQVGVEGERFKEDMAERRYETRVRDDFMSGVRSGVNGTPTFFINGVRYDGQVDEAHLVRALEQAVE